MRVREWWLPGATLTTLLLAGVVVVLACAGSKASQRPGAAGATHPTVDTGLDTCFSCHAQATPKVAAQWRDGRHGMSLVECVVCHGSTGTDFKARPEPTSCRGCHASEVASVTREGRPQSCFECHPAHALHAQGNASPHGFTTQEGRR